jgi:hypothetical protein
MSFKKLLLLALVAGTFFSCRDRHDEEEDIMEFPDTIKTSVLNVGGELFSVPSPMQTAVLVQKTGLPYDKSVLNPASLSNKYSTDDLRALILGVYGADLGYVSIYNQSQDALGYLAAIKQLTDQLGLSAAFDPPTMQRIRDNITNKDSMMALVGLAYRASDAYLKDNQRNGIGGLILTGGWIESMHFSLSAFKARPSDQIRYRVAEQKQALSSIIKILAQNESPHAKEIGVMLQELSKVYEGITFKYTYAEPKTDTVKKVTYINSSTEITVTDEQLAAISEKIGAIRNRITGAQTGGTK